MESINQFFRHRNMRRVNKRQNAGGSDCPKFALTCDNNPKSTTAADTPTQAAPTPDSTTAVEQSSTTAPAPASPTSTSADPAPTSTTQSSSAAPTSTTESPTSSTTASSETSSSTTSSSSTTAPTSSTSASAAVVPSSSSVLSTAAAAAATHGTATAVVVLQTSTASLAASSASSTPTPNPNGSTSTGAIVGGVAAAAVGVIGIIIAIWYFVRKCRSNEDEAFDWNADQARRQSRMIDDDLSSEPTAPSMFAPTAGNLRPPTMIERHVNNASPMLARQRSMGAGAYGQQEYGAVDYGAYGNNNMGYQPNAEEFANLPPHNAFASPYAQAPMGSPVSSTVPSYDTYGNEPSAPSPALMRGPSMGQGAMIHRAPSQSQSAQVTRNPSQMSHSGEDYADLSRSSVTPFQAQTYAEIHDRLGPVAEEPRGPAPAAAIPGVAAAAAAARSQNTQTPLPEYQTAVPRGNPANHNDSKRPDTVYSAMYDDEDAYGGM